MEWQGSESYFVLGEFNQGRLKGVGARIAAETFHRAMQGSKFSIVRDAAFWPTLSVRQ
jgi:hypothetical protein